MNSIYDSKRFMGTKADAVKHLGIDESKIDYAIPESFNEKIREFIECPPVHFVWSYGSLFGFPRPLTKSACQALEKYNQKHGTCYRTDWNVVN